MLQQFLRIFLGRNSSEAPSLDQVLEYTDKQLEKFGTLIQPAPESKPRTSFNAHLPKDQISMLNFTPRQRLKVLTKAVPLILNMQVWVSGSISKPIQHLRNSALLMAKGHLQTRIPITSQDEIGQLAESFNYMASQIEALMKTQRSFVSNAAHELRTPLMTLKLRAEALAEENLTSTERDTYLKEIQQEVDHMARLVSSLLILARIDEGRHPPEKTTTDTVSTLHDIIRNWRIEAQAKGLTFQADIDTNLPELPMSPNDLRLVLDNLLSNAIKYTPQGRVSLKVWHQHKTFSFEISDTGHGFPAEQGPRLFERFYRSETVRAQITGYGLGLSIVKAIVDHYGGRIEATSEGTGKGAVFTVHLPG